MAKQEDKVVKSSPAGINDNFEIVAMDVNNIVENDKYKMKSNNSTRVSDLSIDLSEGMVIKAYEGGKDKVKTTDER